jgi:hypothetical protein
MAKEAIFATNASTTSEVAVRECLVWQGVETSRPPVLNAGWVDKRRVAGKGDEGTPAQCASGEAAVGDEGEHTDGRG